MVKKLAAEAFGTFALVFAGTGAIIINDVSHGTVSHVGIALTFGLVIMSMIYALGHISGGHFNPAVSVGFWIFDNKAFPAIMAILYTISQVVGALVASLLLCLMFSSHPTLGATIPVGASFRSCVLECVLSLILMFVILSVSRSRAKDFAGIAIGGVIALEALFAGPICGASMNPARSFAPALISGNMQSLWVYLIGPFIGAAVGSGLFGWINGGIAQK